MKTAREISPDTQGKKKRCQPVVVTLSVIVVSGWRDGAKLDGLGIGL
jgi:hypothetical protein